MTKMMNKDDLKTKLEKFQDRRGYFFKNISLLERALVHRSYINETSKNRLMSNERLEFLGDAVCELIVSDILFKKFPQMGEGVLTDKRIKAVCQPSFAYLATEWGLDELLILGKGEEMQGGRKKDSILSDCFEAVCGAIYLDGGYDYLYSEFDKCLPDLFEKEAKAESLYENYKSKLQELAFSRRLAPVYTLIGESGPDHKKTFKVRLDISGKPVSEGSGGSKKEAEQDAAKKALKALSDNNK